jgi:tetratricopeptide (TPR) repeat protein
LSASAEAGRASRRSTGLPRRLAYSALATLLALLSLELALRVAGIRGEPDRTTTWFSDHILRPPLWEIHESSEPAARWLVPKQAAHFHPFAPGRGEDVVRIAVLGESAVHGYGVLEPGAFPHRLEQLLQRAFPARDVQVINLGVVAWSSQQILWGARQLWTAGDWDLVFVYAGHNELLELASWKSYLRPAEHRRYTRALLLAQRLEGLRSFAVLRGFLRRRAPPDEGAAAEPPVSAELRGLVPGVDPVPEQVPAMRLPEMQILPPEERARMGRLERRYAARTFAHNFGKLLDLARRHGTPVLFVAPPANDFHDPNHFAWPGEDGRRYAERLDAADALLLAGHWEEAAKSLEESLDEHWDPWALFLMGRAQLSLGNVAEAQRCFRDARAWAEYANRVVPEVTDAIRAFAGRRGVVEVIDLEAYFRSISENGLIGYELIYDHVHPSLEGAWVAAGEMAKSVLREAARGAKGVLPRMGAPGADAAAVDAWVAAARAELRTRSADDPRLWEWNGYLYARQPPDYIADFQGDWTAIRQAQESALGGGAGLDAMSWLWAGNGRFYDYDVPGALDAWERATELDPALCLAHANRAHALRLLGLRAAAREAAAGATRCEPGNSEYREMAELLARLRP